MPPAPNAQVNPDRPDEPADQVRDCMFVPGERPGLIVLTDSAIHFWQSPAPAEAATLTAAAVKALIDQLGAGSFRERKAASAKLTAAGAAVLPQLEAAPSPDPEVRENLRTIIASVRAQQGFQAVPPVRLDRPKLTGLAVHPDGRRWAAIQGANSETRLLLGAVTNQELKVLAEITDPGGANVLVFAPDGTLFVGNDNGTVSVYADTPTVWSPPAP